MSDGWLRKILITFFGIVSLQGLFGALSFISLVSAIPAGGVLEQRLRSSFSFHFSVIREASYGVLGGVRLFEIFGIKGQMGCLGVERGGVVRFGLWLDITCLFGLRFRRTFVTIL